MTTFSDAYDDYKEIEKIEINVRAGVMMSLALNSDRFVAKAEMALFGMVWLLRVKAEMRRCAKCRKEELLKLQKEQEDLRLQKQQHRQCQESHSQMLHRSVEQQTDGAVALVGSVSQDCLTPSTTQTTFYNLDPPGFEGTFCEIHGFIPPKEGKSFNFLLLFLICLFVFGLRGY